MYDVATGVLLLMTLHDILFLDHVLIIQLFDLLLYLRLLPNKRSLAVFQRI
jgi:hypothetical protein